jgi:hypothetical protein
MFETTNQMSLTISNSSHRSSKSHQSQSTVASPQLAEDWLKRERQCLRGMSASNHVWLVVSTLLKNISQLGWFFPIYPKIKNVPNHQPDVCLCVVFFWEEPWTTNGIFVIFTQGKIWRLGCCMWNLHHLTSTFLKAGAKTQGGLSEWALHKVYPKSKNI